MRFVNCPIVSISARLDIRRADFRGRFAEEGGMADYLAALRERVLLVDGAMGTQLMARHLSDADFGGAQYHGCNEALVLTRPDVIEAIHDDYLAAGADVLETDSFT